MSVLRIRALADVQEMGLEGSLVVVGAVLASVSASSLPEAPLWTVPTGGLSDPVEH